MANQTPAKQIYDVLVSKNFDPQLLSADGMPAQDPAETDVFSFDYVGSSGQDYGTVVIMLGDEHDMTLYFGDNVGKSMEGDDKKEWFDFLYQLRMMAKRNLQSFSLQNLNKLKYNMKSMGKVNEGLFESWMGNKTHSWNAKATEARLMVKHKKVIGEGDARYRYVESLFIETVDGERFKLPFTKISAGKAMLEHVKQGGKPYDSRGQHIAQIVNEMNVLSRFYKANKNVITEDEAEQQLVEEVAQYHANLKSQLGKIATKRGYTNYFESWNPEAISEQDMVIEGIRTLFATESSAHRMERALPALTKIKTQGTAMKETGIFEGWINCLAEGTWELPDTPEKQQKLIALLSKEFPVGADATNATEQLYDILGDDDLFDQLEALADDDANADARTIIINRLEQMASNPAVAQVIGKLKIEQKPTEETPEPEAEAPAEEDEEELKEENVDEQIQRISELSRNTLKSYIKKASSSGDVNSASNLSALAAHKLASGDEDDGFNDDHKSFLRSKGIARAVDRLEELSSDTLKSYIKKANKDSNYKVATAMDQAEQEASAREKGMPGNFDKSNATFKKAELRRKGVDRAVDKLEEVSDEDMSDDELDNVLNQNEKYNRGEHTPVVDRIKAFLKKSREAEQDNVDEASDTVEFGPDGKPTAWSHEGDWEKVPKRNGKPVDPRGEVHNLAGRELQRAKQVAGLKEGQSIADYKAKIAAMPDAEVKSLLTVMVGHNRDNPWDQGIIKLLKRELDNRSEPLDEIAELSQQLDELSPNTLGSYVKKASKDATINRKIAGDFENRAKRAKRPDMKDANNRVADDFKSKSFKRQDNVDRAVDRLVKEDEEPSPVESAILNRIMHSHTDLLQQYGPEAVMDAARSEADFVGDVDEIGSSDVSGWVKNVVWELEHSRKVNEGDDDMTDMTKWMEKFDAYEDKNYHTENLIRLAKLVGTPDDVQEAKLIKADHDHKGEMTPINIVRRSKLFKKLWPLAQKKEFDWNDRANAKMNESTALTGQYGHSGKMQAVSSEQFGDKFAEDLARLKALSLIK